MATTAIASANVTKFDLNQTKRSSVSQLIQRLNDVKIDKFVKHNDLVGAWKDADQTKAYAGLVPVINGEERFDLALLTYDLDAVDLTTYDKEGNVEFFTPNDDLHKESRAYLDSNASPSYDAWLTHIVSVFANGAKLTAIPYNYKLKGGRIVKFYMFGATKL